MGDNEQKNESPNPPLDFLVKYSSKLAEIQRKLKNKQNLGNYYDDLYEIKESIKNAKQKNKELDEFDPDAVQELLNIVQNILKQHDKSDSVKDKALLEDFTKLLSNDPYKETRNKLLESSHHEDKSVPISHPFNIEKQEIFDKAYDELEDVDKKCLIFSFTLFNNVDSKVEVRKRELIHWWIGMEYVTDYYNGEQVLEKLSQRHFIVKKRVFRIRSGRDNMAGRSSRYNMDPITLKCLLKLIEVRICDCIRVVNRDLKDTSVVINMSAYIFNEDILERLSKEKAKILHLGSWNSSMDYLVLEDDPGLFSFKTQHTQEVNVLSLQGISRITHLSDDLISKLTNLKVLDLRSCQDLRNLPNLDLQKLICLDLSECYQLQLINIELSSLPQLQVLKGFIVPDEGFISKALSDLKRLVKLTIYNKNNKFPTDQDIKNLCSMEELRKLKVVWVSTTEGSDYSLSQNDFPKKLEKLELQSAPGKIVVELLRVISEMKGNCSLQKLYIRGGLLSNLDHNKSELISLPSIKIVNLRYLPNLQVNWDDFLRLFPNLSYLEVLLCPKLKDFPCDDVKIWEKSNLD